MTLYLRRKDSDQFNEIIRVGELGQIVGEDLFGNLSKRDIINEYFEYFSIANKNFIKPLDKNLKLNFQNLKENQISVVSSGDIIEVNKKQYSLFCLSNKKKFPKTKDRNEYLLKIRFGFLTRVINLIAGFEYYVGSGDNDDIVLNFLDIVPNHFKIKVNYRSVSITPLNGEIVINKKFLLKTKTIRKTQSIEVLPYGLSIKLECLCC